VNTDIRYSRNLKVRRCHMGTSVGYELFESVEVEISRAVATVRLLTTERVAVLSVQGSQAELHFDLGRALARLREDDAVRVVVITGIDDGASWIRGTSKSVCAGSGCHDREDPCAVGGDAFQGAFDLGDSGQA
jgi:hypothetical protein